MQNTRTHIHTQTVHMQNTYTHTLKYTGPHSLLAEDSRLRCHHAMRSRNESSKELEVTDLFLLFVVGGTDEGSTFVFG